MSSKLQNFIIWTTNAYPVFGLLPIASDIKMRATGQNTGMRRSYPRMAWGKTMHPSASLPDLKSSFWGGEEI